MPVWRRGKINLHYMENPENLTSSNIHSLCRAHSAALSESVFQDFVALKA
jgi:hypothetical protein